MKIHILGICGTFMGGIALLAKESGIEVTGSDKNVYPPMSTLLDSQDIHVCQDFLSKNIDDDTDEIVVGNFMRRGMEVVEDMLNANQSYTSGPQWLYEHILKDRWVLAVAGTHGKTTTASILAWILEYADMSPGFLIGGVPENFGVSARLGDTPFFVVEADEYDTAFFDKRSKFVHYHPKTLVLNNLEYDHADIFPDVEAIKTQFHHLMRIVPSEGLVVSNHEESNLDDVLERGCWTAVEKFSAENKANNINDEKDTEWQVEYLQADGSEFRVFLEGEDQGVVKWNLLGKHNISNALAAISAARHVGVPVQHAIDALSEFKGIKRRMQLRGEINNIRVYDDFAHHPTAIKTTLEGLRANVGDRKIIAILEPRSNTMRLGVHQKSLIASLKIADQVVLYQPDDVQWNMDEIVSSLGDTASLYHNIDQLVEDVVSKANTGDQLLVMSNGGFGGIHDKLLEGLQK
ncbi:MAG: UDP-N-acetylmuramate:L-alanyl-gamma-D-glutamyl-meso-diaminopimelate ligase [Aquificaceae bacterium]|nr:MAG: UDP-N-acetylmuramate:L-alanyl-gamma-D-glutamyl-meso-diaminopimelate ligase [Aquificaceae bacterium]